MAKTAEHTKLSSAFSLFTKSKELVLNNLSLFVPLYIIPFLLQIGSTLSTPSANNSSDNERFANYFNRLSDASMTGLVGFGIILMLVTILAMIFVQVMLYSLELKVSSGKKTDFKELWEDAKHYWLRLLGFGVLYVIMLIIGFFLFVIPGLIVLRRYFLTPYYLIDKDLSISEAMRRSAEESKKYSGSVWGVIGVTVLIALISAIKYIGPWISLVLAALYSVAPALRYREIRALS